MDTCSNKIRVGRDRRGRKGSLTRQKRKRNADILTLVLAGHTQVSVANIFGIDRTTVQEILRKYFPKQYKLIKKSRNKFGPETTGEKVLRNSNILDMYYEGASICAIADVFKLSPARVHQLIKRAIAKERKLKARYKKEHPYDGKYLRILS